MLKEILKPVKLNKVTFGKAYEYNQIINRIVIFSEEGKFPDLTKVKVAIIGVEEDRNSDIAGTAFENIIQVRREFYKLFHSFNAESGIADLGNIKIGENANQTYQAMKIVGQELAEFNIVPIFIGGSHDLTYGQFLASNYNKNNLLTLAIVDEKVDLYDKEERFRNTSFIYKLLDEQAGSLYDLSVISCQQQLIDPLIIETFDALNFSTLRLGAIKQDYKEIEPYVRNADLISIDLSCIKQADAPGVYNQSPNGLNSLEACSLTRYAGLSDNILSFGIYEYLYELDFNEQTAKLVAQMVWYFIDGFFNRKNDFLESEEEKLKYIVSFTNTEHQFEFFKSKKSDRWWMNVPADNKIPKKLKPYQLIPCTYKDYLQACKEEIPERWLKAYTKINNWGKNTVDIE